MRATRNAAGRSGSRTVGVHPIPSVKSRRRPAAPSRNSRKKGDRVEQLARDMLVAAGWKVEPRPTRARWFGGRVVAVPVDWFGLYDICAVKPDRTKWVQVVTDVGPEAAKARREILARIDEFHFKGEHGLHVPCPVEVELWRYRKGPSRRGDRLPRGFVVERYNPYFKEFHGVGLPGEEE